MRKSAAILRTVSFEFLIESSINNRKVTDYPLARAVTFLLCAEIL